MIFLKEGDFFLHSTQYDCDNRPLVCQVTNIHDDIVEWRRADCSWGKRHDYFCLSQIGKNVLRVL